MTTCASIIRIYLGQACSNSDLEWAWINLKAFEVARALLTLHSLAATGVTCFEMLAYLLALTYP